ncbi:MAG: hypothetical protein HC896_17075 [Bacteroidales bacterium]|nr:hypothetical protein [Bacteroidales bacterium]
MLNWPVQLTGNSFFQQMQATEFLSLMAITNGATAMGKPIMCNGANLACAKKWLQEYTVNQHLTASGDDMFLLARLKAQKASIGFINNPLAIVKSGAQLSLKEFFHQRLRWASKTKYYKNKDILAAGAVLTFGNLVVLTAIMLTLINVVTGWYLLGLWMLKSIPDILLTYKASRFFSVKVNPAVLMLNIVLYPFYAVFFALYSCFSTSYVWKDRKTK